MLLYMPLKLKKNLIKNKRRMIIINKVMKNKKFNKFI